MGEAEIRALMHPVLGIPLATLVAAGVLASAIAARETDRGARRIASAILLCAGLWSLLELLAATTPERAWARAWLRAAAVALLPVAPMLFQLWVRVRRPRLDSARPLLPLAWLASGAAIALTLAGGAVVADAAPTRWGWALVPGPAYLCAYALLAVVPGWAAGRQLLGRAPRPGLAPRRLTLLERVGVLLLAQGALADVFLPVLGVPFPRLAGAGFVAWAALSWWGFYRTRDPRQAPQRFAREILETLPDGVALVRSDGRIRSANGRLAELSGHDVADLLGASIDELLPGEPERGAGQPESECELHTLSGQRVPVAISRADLSDAEERVAGRVLVIRDLREVVSLRSRLAGAGRLVAVGQLAAGIAHEINNPVAYVGANLRLLARHWEEIGEALAKPRGPAARAALDEGPELLDEARQGLDRVASIVRDVHGFTGGGGPERVLADLAELLDAAARVAAPQLARARIERDYRERPRVPCVSQELMQVFLNLLVNAAQVLGDGGCIRVATRVEDDEAVVEVADDGPGIPPELLERIFEPFFTTKPVGEGTGLGLPISRQIVAQHGGRLEVESQPGRGTRFCVRLPAEGADAAEER
jgi:PAS domain S-box-containing protein